MADPGGGSPDMGNVSADSRQLWLSGRHDNVIDTVNGNPITKIPVDRDRTAWP